MLFTLKKKIFAIAGILALSIIPTTIFSEELTNAEWQAEAAKLEVDQGASSMWDRTSWKATKEKGQLLKKINRLLLPLIAALALPSFAGDLGSAKRLTA